MNLAFYNNIDTAYTQWSPGFYALSTEKHKTRFPATEKFSNPKFLVQSILEFRATNEYSWAEEKQQISFILTLYSHE